MRLHSPANRSSQSAPMPITHLFAGVAVSDFPAARRWYEALFGRPPDMLPKEGEAVWHVTTSGSVYVTASPMRAGSALVTIAVSNLYEHATALAARGLSLDEQGADSSAATADYHRRRRELHQVLRGSRTANRVSRRSSGPVFANDARARLGVSRFARPAR